MITSVRPSLHWTDKKSQDLGILHDLHDALLWESQWGGSFDGWRLFCVFTHVASIYANLLEQKKAFT